MGVIDLLLPDGDGAELVAELQGRIPGTPVAILSQGGRGQGRAGSGGRRGDPQRDALSGMISSLKRLLG